MFARIGNADSQDVVQSLAAALKLSWTVTFDGAKEGGKK